MITTKLNVQRLKYSDTIKNQLFSHWFIFLLASSLLALFQLIYLTLRYEYINPMVPFFYTKAWGDSQLAPKEYLYFIPLFSALLVPVHITLYFLAKKNYLLFAERLTTAILLTTNFVLTLSLLRIITIASTPFESLINPNLPKLAPLGFLAFLATYMVTPRFITWLMQRNIVTIPNVHKHPSMILKRPSARGGGLVFAIMFLSISIALIGVESKLIGVFVGTGLLALLGILDDYQNTNPGTKLHMIENPFFRLVLLCGIATLAVLLGIRIDYIGHPFGGLIDFTQYSINILGYTFYWFSTIVTVLWIVWVLNVLSWSNGVDGQYGGIVGIALLVIAILAFRYTPVDDLYLKAGYAAVIASGVAFGLTKYNWYPSKIMWGFGATCAGFVIATTSILIGGKIATSGLIILIPFLDAIVIFVKRILQKRNPLKGDRGHLHHLLMDRGWGVRRISLFYWVATAFFGMFVIWSADKNLLLLTMTLAGIVAFFILFLNITASLTFKTAFKKPVETIRSMYSKG